MLRPMIELSASGESITRSPYLPCRPSVARNTPPASTSSPRRKMRSSEAMAADDRIFLLGEDVEAGGVFRATEGLHGKYGDRVIDSPLAESSIIGLSIGAAHY